MGLLLRLAGRNILRQKRRTILTGMSIAGGYLLCALSFSMTEGSYNNAIRIFTGDRTGHIQIHDDDYLRRPRIHKTIDDMAAVAAVLDAEPHIQAYTTRVFAPALSYAGHNNAPTQVIGIDPVREKATSRLAQKIASGTWPTGDRDADGYYGALLGESIAATLEVGVGDEIILISQGADGSIANDLYRVAGTVGTRSSAERNNVYLPLHAAQEFLTLGTRVHEVAIVLDDITLAREEAAKLQGELPTLTVSPWQVVEETFYKSMQSDKAGNRVTLSIVVFIVFIGVLNTILMSVLERTREFGVLKAIGSRPGTVLLLIVLETGILSLASIAVGLILSLPVILWFTLVGIELPQPVDLGGVSFGFMTGEFSAYVFLAPMLIVFAFTLLVSILLESAQRACHRRKR